MSKQSEAKEKQGYNPKPPKQICSECEYFESDMVQKNWGMSTYTCEQNIRCGLGGFAIKKTATCNFFKSK